MDQHDIITTRVPAQRGRRMTFIDGAPLAAFPTVRSVDAKGRKTDRPYARQSFRLYAALPGGARVAVSEVHLESN